MNNFKHIERIETLTFAFGFIACAGLYWLAYLGLLEH